MGAIVGMALFTQYYYWFPMTHFINLAVEPCLMMGIDSNMKVVSNYSVQSNASPTMFAYPKGVKLQEKSAVKTAQTAVLSTHSRAKAKLTKQTTELTKQTSEMKIDDLPADKEKTDVELQKERELELEKEKEKIEAAQTEETLNNPCRIQPRQQEFIAELPNQAFAPIVNKRHSGFVMLKKIKLDEETIYYEDIVNKPAETSKFNLII